jgi:cation diffusion facilitator CzcD-associated flavoprotein CzcO
VEKNAIITADGTRHEVDVIIGSTGFNATEPPIAKLIHGRDGRSLSEVWSPHAEALRGTAVAGFPNLFVLIGPNTVLAHNSMIAIIEGQLEYIVQAMDAAPAGTAEATPAAQQRWTDDVQRALANSVWNTGGCSSYYLDKTGRNTTLWPHSADAFRRSVRRFDRSEYVLG